MKTFKEYLFESVKEYKLRIKLGGLKDVPDADLFERIFEKYGLKSMSKFKKTPIQEHPVDFYNLRNCDVYICDATFDYPVTANELYHYIQEQSPLVGSQIVVINSDHPEEIAREEALKQKDKVYKPLLDSEYEKSTHEIQYGDTYNQSMLAELETRKYEVEGGKSQAAKTTNDDPVNSKPVIKDRGNHPLGKRK